MKNTSHILTKPKTLNVIGAVAGISILGGLAMGIFSIGGNDFNKNTSRIALTNSIISTPTICTTPVISNITINNANADDHSTTTFRIGDYINIHGCGFGRFYETEGVSFTLASDPRTPRPGHCQVTSPTAGQTPWTDKKITCRISDDTNPADNLIATVWLGGTVASNDFPLNIAVR